ncbi:Dual specificity protein kinase zak2 [Leucoagaricus sp. SymC.cos]|nr:Dual specificity protein kinase zak2 [Leucoagaricus sp. SymC.cos]
MCRIRFWTSKPLTCSIPIVIPKYEYHPAWPIYHKPDTKHFDNGSIRLFATAAKTCYGPGETITVASELLFGSYRVIPRKIRFDLKLEQTVTYNKKSFSSVTSQQTTTCSRLDHDRTSFTADLACQVPRTNVIPTFGSPATQLEVAHVLAVTVEVHEQVLRVDVPIKISAWARNSPELAQEIQKIGPVPSLGGVPYFEPPLASPGSTDAETLVENTPGKLLQSPETKKIDIIAEDDGDPAMLHHQPFISMDHTTLGGENSLRDSNIVITDPGRPPSLAPRFSLELNRASSFPVLLHPQRRRGTQSSMTVEEQPDVIFRRSVAPGQLGRAEPTSDIGGPFKDLAQILDSHDKSEALLGLRDDKAQTMVNFLDWALLQMDPNLIWLRKHSLIALYRLCKASHFVPECYNLHDITILSEEGGGGFCDIKRGQYGDQTLCLKVVRLFRKAKSDEIIKVINLPLEYILRMLTISLVKAICQRSYPMESTESPEHLAILWCLLPRQAEEDVLGISLDGQRKSSQLLAGKPNRTSATIRLQYLHDNNIIHGDLKGVNVLVNAEGRACISDFGFSSVLIDQAISQTMPTSQNLGGTVRWTAPELLDESEAYPSKASDVWAFGCVCYQPTSDIGGPFKDLAQILDSHDKSEALLGLRDDKAQTMVNFLDWALLQMDPNLIWLRKHSLIALYRLCKASHFVPECYNLHDITILSEEGGGGFCDIKRGQYGDQTLCLKVVRLFRKAKSDEIIKQFAKEAILWSRLNHPNILPFYGVYYQGKQKKMCLVSPWMDNGNLVNYLQENPTAPRRPFICDVIAGLQYLHDNNIIHGDLKGVNVLVNAEGRACISDFGFSSVLIDQAISQTMPTSQNLGGTVRWTAPELLDEPEAYPSKASDVWAFGCVCYQVRVVDH